VLSTVPLLDVISSNILTSHSTTHSVRARAGFVRLTRCINYLLKMTYLLTYLLHLCKLQSLHNNNWISEIDATLIQSPARRVMRNVNSPNNYN